MQNARDLTIWAENALRANDIAQPLKEARLLLEAAGFTRLQQLKSETIALPIEISERFAEFVNRRIGSEPLSRIVGYREFWSLRFRNNITVLDPRPDSETLIEALIERTDTAEPFMILDFGVGSGCLLSAALHEFPKAQGIGIDISLAALSVARENLTSHGLASRLAFCCASWGGALKDDIAERVLANPPYIAQNESLPPEVALYDPPLALYGGADGLDCYRVLAGDIYRVLKKNGLAFLEVGQGQMNQVARIMELAGLRMVGHKSDLAGIERCLIVEKYE